MAAPHYVKCAFCGERFNRDKVPCVAISNRRYVHEECAAKQQEKLSKEEADKEKLKQYILKLFNLEQINGKIERQIKSYMRNYNYTYSGILKTLKYFYEVKGNSIDKANNGIGIVPYEYDSAYNYYYTLWEAQQRNINKIISDYTPKKQEIHISQPIYKQKQDLRFTFLEED